VVSKALCRLLRSALRAVLRLLAAVVSIWTRPMQRVRYSAVEPHGRCNVEVGLYSDVDSIAG
jgi:hypothetical protein